MEQKYTKIKCGKLYDGIKPCFQENMEILIEGRKIKAVGIALNARKVLKPLIFPL